MITYRDRTFCSNRECKRDCFRKLTPEIERAAEAFGLPIAVSEFICLEETEEGKWELIQDEEMS